MDWWMIALSAVIGYLIGTISFARLVVWLKTRKPVETIKMTTPDGEGTLELTIVSATAVRFQLGPAWGGLVSLLDMAKAAIPTLVFLLLYPGEPYFLVVAAFVPVGHNWPVWHGFRGGNGQAAVIGGMLVIDWLGVIVANVAALALGLGVLREGLFAQVGGYVLLIPWMLWRHYGEPLYLWYVGYAVVVNIAFWVSFQSNWRQYMAAKRAGHIPTPEHGVVMFGLDFGVMRKLAPKRYAEIDREMAEREGSSPGAPST